MTTLPANAGWRWIKQGFALFRKRPGVFAMLFTTYLMVQIGLMMIPVVGGFMQPLLAPTFSMIFMLACAQIGKTGELDPQQLRTSFAPPVAQRLFTLGGVYLAAGLAVVIIVIAVFSLMGGGAFVDLLTSNQPIQATPAQNIAVLVVLFVCFLILMPAFWYAPPLIVWQQMPVIKAMFYSFFSVLGAWRAFVVYLAGWLLIGVILPSIAAGILSAIVGKGFAMLLLFLVAIALTVAMYCSFYPTYVEVFGEPELPRS